MFLFQVKVNPAEYSRLLVMIKEHEWDTDLSDGEYWPYLVFTDEFVGANISERKNITTVTFHEAVTRICQQPNHIMVGENKVYFSKNGIKIGKCFIPYTKLDEIYSRYLQLRLIRETNG